MRTEFQTLSHQAKITVLFLPDFADLRMITGGVIGHEWTSGIIFVNGWYFFMDCFESKCVYLRYYLAVYFTYKNITQITFPIGPPPQRIQRPERMYIMPRNTPQIYDFSRASSYF